MFSRVVSLARRAVREMTGAERVRREAEVARRRIATLRDTGVHLYQLRENALAEQLAALRHLATATRSKHTAINALALFHAREPGPDNAREALAWLARRPQDDPASPAATEAAVVAADCLIRLDRAMEARAILERRLAEAGGGPDLAVARADVAAALGEGDAARLAVLNEAFAGLEPLAPIDLAAPLTLENLHAPCSAADPAEQPLISVVIPLFDSEALIPTALRSLSAQSWRNLEILVVNDCSRDGSRAAAQAAADADPRIRIIDLTANIGCHPARNTGIKTARGDFIAFHDADDWSHPRKLETQARLLLENPERVAVIPQWLRLTTELRGALRAYAYDHLTLHNSSIMFRREAVLDKVGYLDSVRASADMEFSARLDLAFGERVVRRTDGPLAIGRVHDENLTTGGAFGFRQFQFSSLRREYREAFRDFHAQARAAGETPFAPFPETKPLFAAPRRMRTREANVRYDVVIASYMAFPAGSSFSSAQEAIAQSDAGLRTGLVHIDGASKGQLFDHRPDFSPPLRAVLREGRAERVVSGDVVDCDLLIVRYPPCLRFQPVELRDVRARDVRIIVNQGTRNAKSPNDIFYDIAACRTNVRALYGDRVRWHPVSPVIRGELEQEDLPELDPEDWVNVMDIDAWSTPRRPFADRKPVLGRHSRDTADKWPTDADAIHAAWPDDGSVEVRVLGGADGAATVLGHAPRRWRVSPFGGEDPKTFLAGVDFYVYYHHPAWTEAFSRSIMEAMASGALVITAPYLKPTYGDAAVYCEPAEVAEVVRRYHADWDAYRAQIARTDAWLRRTCGHERHIARVQVILDRVRATA